MGVQAFGNEEARKCAGRVAAGVKLVVRLWITQWALGRTGLLDYCIFLAQEVLISPLAESVEGGALIWATFPPVMALRTQLLGSVGSACLEELPVVLVRPNSQCPAILRIAWVGTRRLLGVRDRDALLSISIKAFYWRLVKEDLSGAARNASPLFETDHLHSDTHVRIVEVIAESSIRLPPYVRFATR